MDVAGRGANGEFRETRLCKLYGTMTRKGDPAGCLYHRRSALFETPEQMQAVSVEAPDALAPRKAGKASPLDLGWRRDIDRKQAEAAEILRVSRPRVYVVNKKTARFTIDSRIMVTNYAAKVDSFVADKSRLWSDKQLANVRLVGVSNYDLAPGGKRIAALMPVENPEAQPTQNHVTFLMNFADELQRKMPLAK